MTYIKYTPAFIGYNADPNSDNAVDSTDDAVLVSTYVPITVTATGMRMDIGVSSGNLDVGVYDNDGNRLASSGEVASPGVGEQTVNFSSSVVLIPGIYHLALSADNTSLTIGRFGVAGTIGVNQFATSSPLPATLSLPGSESNNAFALALVLSGGITQ